jgi:RNA polymerase sigma factor (sigma-70 family)
MQGNHVKQTLHALIESAQAGDPQAIEALVRRFQGVAYAAALDRCGDPDLATDIAQEAMIALWRGIGGLRSAAALRSWLKTIVARAVDRRRAASYSSVISVDLPDPSESPFDRIARRNTSLQLAAALNGLTPVQREVLTLFYVRGFPISEIAGSLGITESTVKKRLHDARARLRERMAAVSEEDLRNTLPLEQDDIPGVVAALQAIEQRDVPRLRTLLTDRPSLASTTLHDRDPRGDTFLHRVTPGDGEILTPERLEMIRLLMDAGADVNARGGDDQSPALMRAAWGGHAEVIRLLLEHGANPEIGPVDPKPWWPGEMRPIVTASVHGWSEAVRVLIAHGARYSLMHLIFAGLTDEARGYLAENPAAIHTMEEGALPLHHAVAWHYHPEMMALLLDAGADPNAPDALGRSPLDAALEAWRARDEGAIELLHENGAVTDLYAAAGLPDLDALRTMLQEDGASNTDTSPPVKTGGYKSTKSPSGDSMAAVDDLRHSNRPIPTGDKLYASRANEAQADGTTPLFYAAAVGSVDATAMLLEAGADPNVTAKRNWRGRIASSPLTIAVMRGHDEVCRLLLQHGATPTDAAIIMACGAGKAELVTLLLEAGASPNAADEFASCLHWTVYRNRPDMAEILFTHGADPNVRARYRQTPLHVAAQSGKVEMAKLLLAHGAQVSARDANGQTPLEMAIAAGSEEMIEVLRAAGAKS